MPLRPADLPDFDNPPVVEVALSVQFEPLQNLKAVHLGLLWEACYRENFPIVEEHPPLGRVHETFGTQRATRPPFELQLVDTPLLPRVWFLNRDKTQLVQFQSDRFARNWRKLGEPDVYPRYEHIRGGFIEELNALGAFLAENDLGTITPDQCEVTYINHIRSSAGEELHSNLGDVVRLWQSGAGQLAGLAPEDAKFRARYIINSPAADPVGRLTIGLDPAWTPDGQQMLSLTLMARGKPDPISVSGVEAFLNLGRTHIVKAFAELTTARMHDAWRRRQ